MLTTVQELGRRGYQSFGMPVCGPMDELSHRVANLISGNQPQAATLEATIQGPDIRFTQNTTFCISGAMMAPRLNGNSIENNILYHASQDDVLTMGYATLGCRSYIAFLGGVEVPMLMGSRSTYLTGKIGGHHGRALRKGDILPIGVPTPKLSAFKLPSKIIQSVFTPGPIRILPGPEIDHFGFEALKNLLNTTYTIQPNSNRMGYRLAGEPLLPKPGMADVISSPVPPGTIQVPPDGQPIILMADRQTTGGYPRMAVVASIDLPVLGQMKPGDNLTFAEISIAEAQKLIIERNALTGFSH